MADQKGSTDEMYAYVVVVGSSGRQKEQVRYRDLLFTPIFSSPRFIECLKVADKITNDDFYFQGKEGEGIRVHRTATDPSTLTDDRNGTLIYSRLPDFGIYPGGSVHIDKVNNKIVPKWTEVWHVPEMQPGVFQFTESELSFLRSI